MKRRIIAAVLAVLVAFPMNAHAFELDNVILNDFELQESFFEDDVAFDISETETTEVMYDGDFFDRILDYEVFMDYDDDLGEETFEEEYSLNLADKENMQSLEAEIAASVGEGLEEDTDETINREKRFTAVIGKDTYNFDLDSTDRDELFRKYVEKELYDDSSVAETSGSKRSKLYTSTCLTGINALLYNVLKTQICEVAAGQRSSTSFTVTLEELGLAGMQWTAEDLGVDSILDGENISEAAIDAVSIYLYQMDTVLPALLANLPFDLYWFDKSKGVLDSGVLMSAIYDDERNAYVLSFDGEVIFSFSVADDYALSDFEVDTQTGTIINNVRDAAHEIVERYAASEDYVKLLGYKNEICGLVSYNNEAAAGDIAYGNPWQLIWVFDGDSTTNVVCEGYAKAFQYLCDLTSFSNEIGCITVTGTMTGGTGEGQQHMWNIVKWEDGENYLVDVTNCDEGTIGYSENLFFATFKEGSVSEGYSFLANGSLIRYVYDQNSWNMFDVGDLTIKQEGDLKYCITSDGTATITGYSGMPTEIVIPNVIAGYPVTKISEDAFAGCNTLSKVFIGANVIEIEGDYNVEYLENGSFFLDGSGAFMECGQLTHVEFEEGSALEKIGSLCFCGTSIDTIEIPDNVSIIGDAAFMNCPLTFIKIPENVKVIGAITFRCCKQLETIQLHSKIEIIEEGAFVCCEKLNDFPDLPELKEIKEQAFENCYSMESFFLSDTITEIGKNAFNSCRSLRTIEIPDSVTTIEEGLFCGCLALETVDLPNTIEEIKSLAFTTCKNLQGTICIPEGQTYVGRLTFADCEKLEKILMPNSVCYIEEHAFANCMNLIPGSISLPSDMQRIESSAFTGCSGLSGKVIWPESQTEIPDSVFYGTAITSVYIPEGVKKIGDFAFSGCPISELTLPSSLTHVGNYAFDCCSELSDIDLPDSVESIGERAFFSCQLENLVIPENVSYIGNQAFAECLYLTEIYFRPEQPPVFGTKIFDCLYATIHVPENREKVYAESLYEYIGLIEGENIPDAVYNEDSTILLSVNPKLEGTFVVQDTVKRINEAAFKSSELSQVVLPLELKEIGYQAFCQCFNLEQLILPEGLEKIGAYAFCECNSLETIHLPSSLIEIGESAFACCMHLSGDLVIPDTVGRIDDYTFCDTNFTTVTIPEGIEYLGTGVFLNCFKLNTIRIPSSVKEIEQDAFYNCTSLKTVIIPDVVLQSIDEESAFRGSLWYELNRGCVNGGAHSAEVLPGKPATCIENGLTEGMYCSFCGKVLVEQTVIEASGHVIIVDEKKDASCTEDGLTEGSHCSVCGEVLTTQDVVPALGHIWGEWETIEETCGSEKRTCQVCGFIETRGTDALAITCQPVSVTAAIGQRVNIAVEASGDEPTYQWQYLKAGSTSWKNSGLSSARKSTLSFTMSAGYDGMQFRCVVTDVHGGSATSESALITLLLGPGIVSQPESVEAAIGVPVKLKVTAKGTDLTYQWQYQRKGKTTWNKSGLSSATKNTLSFTMSSGYNGMKFRCIITDADGYAVTSDEALITAVAGPGIITQPTSENAAAGTAVRIKTTAVGTGVTYHWQYLKPGTESWRDSKLSSASNATLSFKMSSGYDGMSFRCKVTDADGITVYTDPALVTMVEGPAITKQPVDTTVAIETKATFRITATGDGLTYQWQYQKVGKTTWTNSSSTGNKTNTFKVSCTTGTNGMRFRCVVTDAEGRVAVSDAAVLKGSGTINFL